MAVRPSTTLQPAFGQMIEPWVKPMTAWIAVIRLAIKAMLRILNVFNGGMIRNLGVGRA